MGRCCQSDVGFEGSSVCRFTEIFRAGLINANATMLLRKAAAIANAKLERETARTNGQNNRRQLMLLLKLLGLLLEAVA